MSADPNNKTVLQLTGPCRFACAECGSDNVWGEARCTWDDTISEWFIDGPIRSMNCDGCGRRDVEVHIIEITRPLSSSVPVFMRAKRFANEEGAL